MTINREMSLKSEKDRDFHTKMDRKTGLTEKKLMVRKVGSENRIVDPLAANQRKFADHCSLNFGVLTVSLAGEKSEPLSYSVLAHKSVKRANEHTLSQALSPIRNFLLAKIALGLSERILMAFLYGPCCHLLYGYMMILFWSHFVLKLLIFSTKASLTQSVSRKIIILLCVVALLLLKSKETYGQSHGLSN